MGTPTLRQYLRFRLGTRGGRTAWFNFFIKPFGASSFAEFWRWWNPVYGYFLYYYSYRPMSRVMPRPIASFLTFVLCGFLHDLPAWVFTREACTGRRADPRGCSRQLTTTDNRRNGRDEPTDDERQTDRQIGPNGLTKRDRSGNTGQTRCLTEMGSELNGGSGKPTKQCEGSGPICAKVLEGVEEPVGQIRRPPDRSSR